jgi:hypothetical protein
MLPGRAISGTRSLPTVSVRAWIAVVRPAARASYDVLEAPFPPAAEPCALTCELSTEAVPITPAPPVTDGSTD